MCTMRPVYFLSLRVRVRKQCKELKNIVPIVPLVYIFGGKTNRILLLEEDRLNQNNRYRRHDSIIKLLCWGFGAILSHFLTSLVRLPYGKFPLFTFYYYM